MDAINKKIKKLPNKPGVYLFYNSKKELIYVGKATSLKSRVRSYFLKKQNERPIEIMAYQIKDIKYKITDSVLEAIILEGNLIKKFRPKYNVMWKDDKSWNYITISKDEFAKIGAIRERELKLFSAQQIKNNYRAVFGPYPALNIKETMKILRRIFHISFCAPNSKRPCLHRQMGECLGVCTGEISAKEYQKKVIMPLTLFLNGKKARLIKKIKQEMIFASKKQDYEEAGRLRDQIKLLKRIQDIALINDSFIKEKFDGVNEKFEVKRIEGYDISNLGNTGKVGSMVVFDSHGPIKSEYRKFNIYSVKGQSDVGCLNEVLGRRLKHKNWLWPDIILVDGGRPQINTAKKVLREKNINIPIVGIAKGPKRLKNEFYLISKNPAIIEWVKKHKNLLIQVRDEAHRFAITFQRQKRKIK
jgi:excinuclease ABC subunit C